MNEIDFKESDVLKRALALAVNRIYKKSRECPAMTFADVKCWHYEATSKCPVGERDHRCWEEYFIRKAEEAV